MSILSVGYVMIYGDVSPHMMCRYVAHVIPFQHNYMKMLRIAKGQSVYK
jgi:hypothetical protein